VNPTESPADTPPALPDDERFMREALRLARDAMDAEEVPVGCVIVHEGRVIARAHNQRETLRDPTAHAEMIALTQAAAALERWRLETATVYCTVEPCCMCAGALVNARIERVVYGVPDPKSGGCGSIFDICRDPRVNHRVRVTPGVLREECLDLLREFFTSRRTGRRPKPEDWSETTE
jgi:tRNA(adenine34) deaminase